MVPRLEKIKEWPGRGHLSALTTLPWPIPVITGQRPV
jgi:hypothetical protein